VGVCAHESARASVCVCVCPCVEKKKTALVCVGEMQIEQECVAVVAVGCSELQWVESRVCVG